MTTEEVTFVSRTGLTIRTVPGRKVEIFLKDEFYQLPGIALSILDVFATPHTIEDANDVLAARMTEAEERLSLDDSISKMLRVGILEPAPMEPLEAGEIAQLGPEVSRGYGAPGIHVSMLRDDARTVAYLAAIRECVRPDDVVLDIGTGTGVLAVAAPEAGARQVYAIEANPKTARFARALISGSPHRERIQLIEGWSTEAQLPERCDLLVSEMIGDDPLGENILAMTRDAIVRHLKPGARLIPSRLDVLAQPVRVPRQIHEEAFFCERDITGWEEKYGLNFHPLLATNPPQTQSLSLPQEMKGWDFVGKPRVITSIDLAQDSPDYFDEQFDFELGDQTANGVVVFFDTTLSEGQQLSTDPYDATANNHWLSPCNVFQSAFRDRLSIGYRYGISYEADGVYLPDPAPTE